MAQSEQNDEKIIQLLNQLPKVTDQRPKEEIYRNIKKQMSKTKPKRTIFIPAISTFAGLLVVLLLFPVIFQKSPTDLLMKKEIKESAESHDANISLYSAKERAKTDMENEEEKMNAAQNFDVADLKTAAYEEDGFKVYTYGVLTADYAEAIPVSVIDPVSNEDWLTRMKDVSKTLDDPRYGLQNMDPFINSIRIDDPATARIIIDSSNRYLLDNGNVLKKLVQYTFKNTNIKTVHFTDEDGNKVEDGHYGEIPDEAISETSQKAYFLYKGDAEISYIVPDNSDVNTLQDAIEKMDEAQSDYLLPLIPENVQLEVQTGESKVATIRFKNSFELLEGDQEENMRMIEGLLLTAKEFGFEFVQFENLSQEEWQGFNFSQPIKVPIAPNVLN
ncbi:GerMN domain-containing protein [Bacillus niameyensis]|uniref:GerMN domain-containing protein n=1 Tax=Bacillus niameyensis TaxID=1522308 RepID=UPI000781A437|nr:GerMN domain-containing protein [Bacillus niameyensis]